MARHGDGNARFRAATLSISVVLWVCSQGAASHAAIEQLASCYSSLETAQPRPWYLEVKDWSARQIRGFGWIDYANWTDRQLESPQSATRQGGPLTTIHYVAISSGVARVLQCGQTARSAEPYATLYFPAGAVFASFGVAGSGGNKPFGHSGHAYVLSEGGLALAVPLGNLRSLAERERFVFSQEDDVPVCIRQLPSDCVPLRGRTLRSDNFLSQDADEFRRAVYGQVVQGRREGECETFDLFLYRGQERVDLRGTRAEAVVRLCNPVNSPVRAASGRSRNRNQEAQRTVVQKPIPIKVVDRATVEAKFSASVIGDAGRSPDFKKCGASEERTREFKAAASGQIGIAKGSLSSEQKFTQSTEKDEYHYSSLFTVGGKAYLIRLSFACRDSEPLQAKVANFYYGQSDGTEYVSIRASEIEGLTSADTNSLRNGRFYLFCNTRDYFKLKRKIESTFRRQYEIQNSSFRKFAGEAAKQAPRQMIDFFVDLAISSLVAVPQRCSGN